MAPDELRAYFDAEVFDVFAEHRAHVYTRWVETIGS